LIDDRSLLLNPLSQVAYLYFSQLEGLHQGIKEVLRVMVGNLMISSSLIGTNDDHLPAPELRDKVLEN
jgi:hypothetical protein